MGPERSEPLSLPCVQVIVSAGAPVFFLIPTSYEHIQIRFYKGDSKKIYYTQSYTHRYTVLFHQKSNLTANCAKNKRGIVIELMRFTVCQSVQRGRR